MLEKDPLWYKDAIIYETHVRAFFDGNDDGVGDFRGLIQKLDYLQDLGINCLWLLPFYPSPLRDDGYDISSYKGINPVYGSIRDFRAFVSEAHKRNIRIIAELVINHTSDAHPWFQVARKSSRNSRRRNYYVWSETNHKYQSARIIFTDSEKSNWSWDPVANAYYWHRFFSHQPDLNFNNPAVLKEMIKVLRFWLDMGIDGLRLDAVPYLIEREGTNCENLPETHAILKEIRSQMDQFYEDRMLLVEANQWPEDVLPYFGNGDESHMAFHFPLMPRIFVALRQEDRHPITDILRQTPDIPETCQWGLFLRNHDELTLEMVTNEERDYMYKSYATDPRMRINLGIRRRLAPLVDNSRRRMEMLNSLLFSLKGTPIIYYGDEIGMGDNVYLGDRNGVRTPMQWSSDRNAGFSRADFAKLYSPPIMDPVYGYQAINVEAQHRDPSSFLNWMKRMIALRKSQKTFGRGSLEILLPSNRKILAYVRKHEETTVLCLANLSRFLQPAQLDLSRYSSLTPVELLGHSEFPPISTAPYFFTLAPHSFYWFELKEVPETIRLKASLKEQELETIPVMALRGSWDALMNNENRKQLETYVIPDFLRGRRWFAGKAQENRSIRISDWYSIPTRQRWAALVFITVEYESGRREVYSMPLCIPASSNSIETYQKFVLARIRCKAESALLVDALADDIFCEDLLRWMWELRTPEAEIGKFSVGIAPAFDDFYKEIKDNVNVSRNIGEQSNTSIIFNDRLILKFFRRSEPGPNPEAEILLFLMEKTKFDRVPLFIASIECKLSEEVPTTVAVMQNMIQNQGTAWDYTIEELHRYFERVLTSDDEDLKELLEPHFSLAPKERTVLANEMIGIYLDHCGLLGRRTGELHVALTADAETPDFEPEFISQAELSSLYKDLQSEAEAALVALEANLNKIPERSRDSARRILKSKLLIQGFLEFPAPESCLLKKIKLHGDYHLGQVLWVKNDFVIIDFEGEPFRPLAERRKKHSPLKDVAGMLRSFSYASYAALFSVLKDHEQDSNRLRTAGNAWQSWICTTFLNAYMQTTASSNLYPANLEDFQKVLLLFLMDKALYELRYELNNRPEYVPIPLSGILDLINLKVPFGEPEMSMQS